MTGEPGILRRMIIFGGRGRIGNSTIANAVFEEMQRRAHEVTAWDLDRAPMLARFVEARRPTGPDGKPDGSDPARRRALEKAIDETIRGTKHAVVYPGGGDDPMVLQLQDRLPDMTALFADAGLETVAVHVVGPQLKDLAYYRAVQGTATYARQVVVLNYGMAPDGVDPDAAFTLVRKTVGNSCPVFVVRQLPPAAIDALLDRDKGYTMREVAENDASGLIFTHRMELISWLNGDAERREGISPLVDELMQDPPPVLPAAA